MQSTRHTLASCRNLLSTQAARHLTRIGSKTSRLRFLCCRAARLVFTSAADMALPVKRRPVTTAFVQRGDGKLLLVQRSSKVSTYQGMWGGVSGGVEEQESILHRGLTEVEEETGIDREQLRVVATGRPLPVDDAARHFLVYPMLLRSLDAEPHVTLNWENVDAKWVVDDSELQQMPTVPLLSETLRRVVLPAHLQKHVDALDADREHGAAELAMQVLQAFEAAAQHTPQHDEPAALMETWRNLAYHLATCRPSMAALGNAACDVMLHLEQELQGLGGASVHTVKQLREALQDSVDNVGERMAHARQALASQVADRLLANGGTVMTLSYSSSVVKGIKLAAQQQAAAASQHGLGSISAIVCESRPLLEGLKTAEQLIQAGVSTTVITDAQAAVFVPKADVVIIGADCVTQNGAVNKVGSYLLALAAHQAGIPVYAVADTSKIAPAPVADVVLPNTVLAAGYEEKEAAEVTACWPPDMAALASSRQQQAAGEQEQGQTQQGAAAPLHLRNVYFEAVPMSLLAGVVTEEGVLAPADIADGLQLRHQQYFQAFGVPQL